ncbi:NAD(P)-dependent oxidoreductase [Komagataeibacter melomenusus]
MTVRLVLLDPMTPSAMEKFSAFIPAGWELATSATRGEEDQIKAISHATYAITGDVPVTAAMLRAGAANGLKAVHKWGVGYDNIDLATARELKVRILRTTGSNAVAVAETALALIMALQRNIVTGHVGIEHGEWLKGRLPAPSMTLSGKTIGLVGLGYIGKQVARLVRGFGCTILYNKPTRLDSAEERELGVTYVDRKDIFTRSDVISFHCALSADTAGMVNRQSLQLMRKNAILINTARGGLIVEDDLIEALENGALRGAGLDVFATEPLPQDHPFRHTRNLVMTPHIGASSADAYAPSVKRMIGNLECVEAGMEPPALDVLV